MTRMMPRYAFTGSAWCVLDRSDQRSSALFRFIRVFKSRGAHPGARAPSAAGHSPLSPAPEGFSAVVAP